MGQPKSLLLQSPIILLYDENSPSFTSIALFPIAFGRKRKFVTPRGCRRIVGGGDDMARFVVIESRLPQMITAVLAGIALSVSGLVMQTLFANPLADPALLGVNSGASLGVALAMLLLGGSWAVGNTIVSGLGLTILFAFMGACAVIALLLVCSHYLRGNLALLVVGVMLLCSFRCYFIAQLLCFCRWCA